MIVRKNPSGYSNVRKSSRKVQTMKSRGRSGMKAGAFRNVFVTIVTARHLQRVTVSRQPDSSASASGRISRKTRTSFTPFNPTFVLTRKLVSNASQPKPTEIGIATWERHSCIFWSWWCKWQRQHEGYQWRKTSKAFFAYS